MAGHVAQSSGWSRPVTYAVVLHVVIIVFLFAGFRFARHQQASSSVMQAVVVRDSQTEREQPPTPDPAKAQDEDRKRRAEQQQAENQRRAETERVRAETERKRQEEQKAQTETLRKKEETERKVAVERKKQEEAEQQKKVDAEKRKRDDERKKQDRQRAEDSIKEQMAEEEKTRATTKASRLAPLIDKYKAAIAQKVQRHWAPPPTSRKGLKATIHVRQTPSGEVLDVGVVRSSGDATFDRSVVNAVYKASPLPLPENTDAFDRDIEFNFDPDKAKGGLD